MRDPLRLSAALLVPIALSWVGCGAAAGPSVSLTSAPATGVPHRASRVGARAEGEARDTPREVPRALVERLHVRCRADDDACTGAIGLLARLEGGGAQRCTAALIAPDRALTASHCLPPAERHPGAGCADTWLAFPTPHGPLAWAGCARVLRADGVSDDAVMRSDVAVLQLDRALDRPTIPLDPAAPSEGDIVTVVAVQPHPIYASQHEVAGRRCRVASQDSAVETFGVDAAAVGWLMSCPSYPGNSGSPVLDGRGRLRALMHAGSGAGDAIAVMSVLPVLPSLSRVSATGAGSLEPLCGFSPLGVRRAER